MKYKHYFFMDYTESYYKKLRQAYQDIQSDKDIEYLYFAFITLASGTLEYSLNHLIHQHYLHEFGPEDCKRFVNVFQRLEFANKLISTPIIITQGQYYFNENHSTIKELEQLISLRNKILHKKGSMQVVELDVSIHEIKEGMNVQIEYDNNIDNITKDECIKYGRALGAFKSEFMSPYLTDTLVPTDLLIKK